VPQVPVVDTIGAGDSFCGSFVSWWHHRGHGRDKLTDSALLRDATAFATAVAAITCQRSAPTRLGLTNYLDATSPD